MFVDELTIEACAGRGGDGVVRWHWFHNKPLGGPAGGDGGNGGNVYARAVRDIGLLGKYRGAKIFKAEDGGQGGKNSLHGKNGEDLYVDLPIGSVITNTTTNESVTILQEGETALLLKGGRGGFGNEHFKSATNRAPQECTPGKEGEAATFDIELQLVVDAGLIGFPNAGKSSLINELTNAQSRIGSYPFTTLSPHLGVCFGYILADIPGLIEGAAGGKGLGHSFLRHVKRTKVLVHCVSLEHEEPLKEYEAIRKELGEYDQSLTEKPEIAVLTKSDLVSPERAAEIQVLFRERGIDTHVVSVLDDGTIKAFRDALIKFLEN